MRKYLGILICIPLLLTVAACDTTTEPAFGANASTSAEPILIVAQTLTAEPSMEAIAEETEIPLATEIPITEMPATEAPPAQPTDTPAAEITPTPAAKQADESQALLFVDAAKAKLGQPHAKGGESEEEGGYDTSGLVYACLQELGVKVSRKSSKDYALMEDWTKIDSYDALSVGDLLFFKNPADGEVNVVGICIGNGEMIYASSSKGEVITCSYQTNYWVGVFAHALRVF